MGERGQPEEVLAQRREAGNTFSGMRPYYYRYNAQGERIWWQTGTQADSYYAAERHLRSLDGRLLGVFDGDGVLQYWNIHAGGMSPIGRLTTEGNPPPPQWRVGDEDALGDSVRVAVQEAAPYEAREAIAYALDAPIGSSSVNQVLQEVAPQQGALVSAVQPALDAAGEGPDRPDRVGQAYYSALVNPIKNELTDAFFAVGYTSLASDTLGEKSGGRLAVRMAEVVGGAVAAFEADTTGGDSTTVCPPEGCFWSPESRRYYVRDHLGSVRAVVDGSGYVVEAKDYYAWGLEMPGRVYVIGEETEEGFTGHERDAETSMLYAGARYYLPALGRWTAVDPLADQFPGVSPYNYALNNPISLFDPDGAAPVGDCPSCEIQRRLRDQEILSGRSTPEQRARERREQAQLADIVGRTLVEPYDYLRTAIDLGVDAVRGEFSLGSAAAQVGAAATPLLSGAAGRAAVGFARGTGRTALEGMRGGGGHAIRHLQREGLIPNTGSLSSQVDAFAEIATPILEKPTHSAAWRIGDTAGQGFLGAVDGRQVMVVVASEGPQQGKVISAFVPDANQLEIFTNR